MCSKQLAVISNIYELSFVQRVEISEHVTKKHLSLCFFCNMILPPSLDRKKHCVCKAASDFILISASSV